MIGFVTDKEADVAFSVMQVDKTQLDVADVAIAFLVEHSEEVLEGIRIHSSDEITASLQALMDVSGFEKPVDLRIVEPSDILFADILGCKRSIRQPSRRKLAHGIKRALSILRQPATDHRLSSKGKAAS